MRHLIIAVAVCSTGSLPPAQQAQCITATSTDPTLSPRSPVDVLSAQDPEHVYPGRLDAINYGYNQPMGRTAVPRQAGEGSRTWSVSVGAGTSTETQLIPYPSIFASSFHLMSASLLDGADVCVAIIDASERVIESRMGLNAEFGQAITPAACSVMLGSGGHTVWMLGEAGMKVERGE